MECKFESRASQGRGIVTDISLPAHMDQHFDHGKIYSEETIVRAVVVLF